MMFRISPRVPFARLQVCSRLYFPLNISILRLGFSVACNLLFLYLFNYMFIRICIFHLSIYLGARIQLPESAFWFPTTSFKRCFRSLRRGGLYIYIYIYIYIARPSQRPPPRSSQDLRKDLREGLGGALCRDARA